MLFNSVAFIVFFVLVVAIYWALPFRAQNWFLLGASYVFYGWWGFTTPELRGDKRFLPLALLIASTLATYYCAKALHPLPEGSRRRRMLFWIGVAANVGLLAWFKYRGFFLENIEGALAQLGWNISPTVVKFLLPAGISFYTFQGLSYLIDVYGGANKPAERLGDFALYHGYFPQLVAGPIERTRHLFPQLMTPRILTPEALWTGLQLIVIGYVKKIAIADAIAPLTADAFNPNAAHTGLELLLGIYLFAFQMYGDFSGYTDIARGVSRLLGIELMLNFRQPYFSRNISEFWERWHISLSTWLRDYIFVPLCRKFRGRNLVFVNLFATLLISGLWHGASWNFVVWGALLGIMLVIHKLWSGPKASKHPHRPRNRREWLLQLAGMTLTFHCVCLTLVLVKSQSLSHAWSYVSGILILSSAPTDLIPLIYVLFYGLLILTLDFPCWWHDRELPLDQGAPSWRRGVAFGSLLLLLAFLGENEAQTFVYFQF